MSLRPKKTSREKTQSRKAKGGIVVRANKRPQEISLPTKSEYGRMGIWWINGYGEFTHKGILFRHYCLERLRGIGASPTGTAGEGAYNAMVMRVKNKWIGILLSDGEYYRKGWTKEKMARVVLGKVVKQ